MKEVHGVEAEVGGHFMFRKHTFLRQKAHKDKQSGRQPGVSWGVGDEIEAHQNLFLFPKLSFCNFKLSESLPRSAEDLGPEAESP